MLLGVSCGNNGAFELWLATVRGGPRSVFGLWAGPRGDKEEWPQVVKRVDSSSVLSSFVGGHRNQPLRASAEE